MVDRNRDVDELHVALVDLLCSQRIDRFVLLETMLELNILYSKSNLVRI